MGWFSFVFIGRIEGRLFTLMGKIIGTNGEGYMEALRELVRTNRRYYNIKLPEWAVGGKWK